MRRPEPGPVAAIRRGGELRLDGEALTAILKDVLARGAAVRFRARGTSMSPFIKDGDVVTIVPRGKAPLQPGAVVAFLRPGDGRAAVHRIVEAGPSGYVIKGDNAASPDGVVPAENLLGVVERIVRDGKTIASGLGPGRGLIAFLSRTGLLRAALAAGRGIRKRARRRNSA